MVFTTSKYGIYSQLKEKREKIGFAAGKCWIEQIPSSESHARTLVIVNEGGTTTGVSLMVKG